MIILSDIYRIMLELILKIFIGVTNRCKWWFISILLFQAFIFNNNQISILKVDYFRAWASVRLIQVNRKSTLSIENYSELYCKWRPMFCVQKQCFCVQSITGKKKNTLVSNTWHFCLVWPGYCPRKSTNFIWRKRTLVGNACKMN